MTYQWDFVDLEHPGGMVLECLDDGKVIGAVWFNYNMDTHTISPWKTSSPPDVPGFTDMAWRIVQERIPGAILDTSSFRSGHVREQHRRGAVARRAGEAPRVVRVRASGDHALAGYRLRRLAAGPYEVELTKTAAKALRRLGSDRERITRELEQLEQLGVVDHPKSVALRGPMKGYWEIKMGYGATAMRIILDFSGNKITVYDIVYRGSTGWSER